MQSNNPEVVKVEQCDRAATDALAARLGIGSQGDRTLMDRAFARHRLSARTPSAGAGDIIADRHTLFDALKKVYGWLGAVAECDFDEVVADGGITAAMVVQQEAVEQAKLARAAIDASIARLSTLREGQSNLQGNLAGSPTTPDQQAEGESGLVDPIVTVLRNRDARVRFGQTGFYCQGDADFDAKAADHITSLSRRLAEAEGALRKAQQLIEVIEQRSACNTWWVNADDPEEAVCSVASAIDAALRQAGEGV